MRSGHNYIPSLNFVLCIEDEAISLSVFYYLY